MEKTIEKLLAINKDVPNIATVETEDSGTERISNTVGLIYKYKNKFATVYFTSSNNLFIFLKNLSKKNNFLLSMYLQNHSYDDFLPRIDSNELGTTIYFIDKEVIDILDLSNQNNCYKLKANVKRRYDFKNKACKNRLGRQFTPSIIAREIRSNKIPLKSIKEGANILGIESKTYVASEGLKYSFGVELETSQGLVTLQDYFINRLNLSSIRDGSVKGAEYVTGVLKGDSGFNQLYRVSTILNKQNKVDKSCGMHVHIGGANFNKAFSVYAHILSEKIQDSMFSIVSKTRRGNSYCGDVIRLCLEDSIKKYGASYGVEVAYKELYEHMTYGRALGSDHNKKHNHHYGRYCGKYNGIEDEDNFRYKWVNLIPCNFNVRGISHPKNGYNKNADTIEFRFHSGTLNYTKIKNFTLICMAFVNYVENNENDILSKDVITLEDIIKATYKRNVKPLLAYVEMRQKLFNNEPYLLESSDKQPILKTKKERICV
jgi:hypothetical protein